MAKIGINFRAVCLCLSCRGCKVWAQGAYVIQPHCKRQRDIRPDCLPLVGCPGYQKEGTEKEVSPRDIVQSILDDEDLPFY